MARIETKETDSTRNSHLQLMEQTLEQMAKYPKGKEYRKRKRFYNQLKRFLKKYDKMMGYK
jgi:hypothetical protein